MERSRKKKKNNSKAGLSKFRQAVSDGSHGRSEEVSELAINSISIFSQLSLMAFGFSIWGCIYGYDLYSKIKDRGFHE